jgi:hypothetical protein
MTDNRKEPKFFLCHIPSPLSSPYPALAMWLYTFHQKIKPNAPGPEPDLGVASFSQRDLSKSDVTGDLESQPCEWASFHFPWCHGRGLAWRVTCDTFSQQEPQVRALAIGCLQTLECAWAPPHGATLGEQGLHFLPHSQNHQQTGWCESCLLFSQSQLMRTTILTFDSVMEKSTEGQEWPKLERKMWHWK